MDKHTLDVVREWAQSRVASGEEPPWTFHKLKQLTELLEEFSQGMDAVVAFDPEALGNSVSTAENVVQIDAFRAKTPNPEVQLPT